MAFSYFSKHYFRKCFQCEYIHNIQDLEQLIIFSHLHLNDALHKQFLGLGTEFLSVWQFVAGAWSYCMGGVNWIINSEEIRILKL